MSELTDILKGIAHYQWLESGLPKSAKSLFEGKIKDIYYNATLEQKTEMKIGFQKTKEEHAEME